MRPLYFFVLFLETFWFLLSTAVHTFSTALAVKQSVLLSSFKEDNLLFPVSASSRSRYKCLVTVLWSWTAPDVCIWTCFGLIYSTRLNRQQVTGFIWFLVLKNVLSENFNYFNFFFFRGKSCRNPPSVNILVSLQPFFCVCVFMVLGVRHALIRQMWKHFVLFVFDKHK